MMSDLKDVSELLDRVPDAAVRTLLLRGVHVLEHCNLF
jgi:hypothetical protein